MQNLAKIVLIDNNDSFTYNLVELLNQIMGEKPQVIPHDFDSEIPEADAFIFSPGPGLPQNQPLMKRVMDENWRDKPILGICLGHQFIGQYFGAQLKNLGEPLHGIEAKVDILEQDSIFHLVESPFTAALYHSWILEELQAAPDMVTLAGYKGIPMAIKHRAKPIYGWQFHPESFLTKAGKQLMKNWLALLITSR